MSELYLSATVAARGLDVELTVPPGEVLAVLGPNGAGKSSTLHVIAGLLKPDTGVVRIGERTLTDTSAGIQVATHDRKVGLLLQNPLLFPHLTVAANVAFGPRSRSGLGKKQAHDVARRWLDEVDAGDLADRNPTELSGGQAQRVAIARALAAEPDVLLVDEPLTGLDVAVATSVRGVLRRAVTATGRATILITHDLLDVLALADRVLVLEAGQVAEIGPVADVLTRPRSRFGARIAGVNLVRGIFADTGILQTPAGAHWYGLQRDELRRRQVAVAVFSPTAVSVYRDLPHGSPRNAVPVTVAELANVGGTVRVRGAEQDDGSPGLAADITAEAAAELRLASGERVWFAVKTQEVALHAATRPSTDLL